MKWIMVVGVLVASSGWAANGANVEMLRGDLEQGGFYVAKVDADSKVAFMGKPVTVGKDGLVVLGFDRAQPEANVLKVCDAENVCEEMVLEVKPRKFKIQPVLNVPQN